MNRFRIQTQGDQRTLRFKFVESVRVRETPEPVRIKWKHLVLTVFWFLVIVKCLLAHWAIVHWEMPVASIYVWAPTLFAAAICTIAFLSRGDEEPVD